VSCAVMRVLFVAAVLALAAGTARAQSLEMDWRTVDGGGAVMGGGGLTVSGTAGQPDTGVSTGGTLALEAGFWPGPEAGRCDADGDGDCDAVDLAWVVRCAADPANCGCPGDPDLDRSGSVDAADDLAVLAGAFG